MSCLPKTFSISVIQPLQPRSLHYCVHVYSHTHSTYTHRDTYTEVFILLRWEQPKIKNPFFFFGSRQFRKYEKMMWDYRGSKTLERQGWGWRKGGQTAHFRVPAKSIKEAPPPSVCDLLVISLGSPCPENLYPQNQEEAELGKFPDWGGWVGDDPEAGWDKFPGGGFPFLLWQPLNVSSAKKRGLGGWGCVARDYCWYFPLSLSFRCLKWRNLRLSVVTLVWDSFLKRCSGVCEDCQERVWVTASEQTLFGYRNSQRYDLFIGKETELFWAARGRGKHCSFFKCCVERSYQRAECQPKPGVDTEGSSSFVYILEGILGLGI